MKNINKKTAFVVAFVVVAVCVVVPFIVHSENTAHIEGMKVVIDAGHGGFDGGVVSSNGVRESDINLMIARHLERQLTRHGISVVMTRRDRGAIADTKKADMAKRAEIARTADAEMLVSIHTNKYSDTNRRGVQVFYDDTGKWSRYGTGMQNIMNEYINKRYSGRSDLSSLGGDYFMTKCVDVPSIIVECGFISNSEDAALLVDESYQEELAHYIALGIESMLML